MFGCDSAFPDKSHRHEKLHIWAFTFPPMYNFLSCRLRDRQMEHEHVITRVQSDEDVATLRSLMQPFATVLRRGEICRDGAFHEAALKKNLVGADAIAEAWLLRKDETALGYVLFYLTLASFSGKRNIYIEDFF